MPPLGFLSCGKKNFIWMNVWIWFLQLQLLNFKSDFKLRQFHSVFKYIVPPSDPLLVVELKQSSCVFLETDWVFSVLSWRTSAFVKRDKETCVNLWRLHFSSHTCRRSLRKLYSLFLNSVRVSSQNNYRLIPTIVHFGFVDLDLISSHSH